jgi:2-phospho-L-lactate guanylyltransferase
MTQPGHWVVVVPVKDFPRAKSRMTGVGSRQGLAVALAADTVATVRATPGVRTCLVVGGPGVRPYALTWGAEFLAERPEGGLNAALRAGRDAAWEAGRPEVALLVSDLPLLTSEALAEALEHVPASGVAVVGDAAGTGTTMLASRDGRRLHPEFGPGSLARHRASALDLSDRCADGLRQDLDTFDHLEAMRLPADGRTRRWQEQLQR